MFDSPNPNALAIAIGIFLVVQVGAIAFRYLMPREQLASGSAREFDKLEGEITALKQECVSLRAQLQQQSQQLTAEYQNATFQQLQSLLTQYKSVRQTIAAKPDLPAKNLIALFAPLDDLLSNWGYATIGEVWQQVMYDPQLHQPDRPDIATGEFVYIRFVGYRERDGRILVPAKVSRTLPAGAN